MDFSKTTGGSLSTAYLKQISQGRKPAPLYKGVYGSLRVHLKKFK